MACTAVTNLSRLACGRTNHTRNLKSRITGTNLYRGESMSKLKSVVQGLWVPALLICITAGMITPSHAADNVQFVGAGSSAMWQNMALAAYNSGSCVAGAGATAPCFHYTAKGFRLVDQRSSTIGLETGNIWVVWDSNTTSRNVWMYVNVDSVVGNRCYFAQPHCLAEAPSTGIPAPGNLITLVGTIWGGSAADTALPADVQSVLTTGIATTAAMTDIRPEDALYAQCRANTSLDTTNEKKGLGYNTNNLFNKLATDIYCPPNVTSGTSFPTLIGTSIGNPFTTTVAQVIAFNISGTDPFPPNTAIPASTVVSVGAAPILFITRRTGTLKSQLTATDTQITCAYTTAGAAGCFGSNTAIDTYQREPMSGTFNTTEFSVVRNNPFQTNASLEDGISPPTDNPLKQEVTVSGCATGTFAG